MVQLVYFSAVAMCILGAITVVSYRLGRRLDSAVSKYGAATTLSAAGMFLAYVGMTTIQFFFEQTGLPLLLMELSRFIGYTIMWAGIVYVVAAISGASRQLSLALFVAIAGQLWMTFFAWKTAFVPQQVVLISPLLLAGGGYLLYGPVVAAAKKRSERRLSVFSKLKHIMLLGWFGQVATVVVHPSTLGLTTVFTDWVTIMYVELLIVGAFVGVVYSNAVVFDQIPGSSTDGTGPKDAKRATDRTGSGTGAQQ
ncbi:hypothetical protein ABNG03_02095 [Halorubrum sp. RMP-47]|uniref:Rhodopsin n=1 Tax=Halorubrum miltondacostae TaxID=3076378 RepID=A0ABD5M0C3_9EURY